MADAKVIYNRAVSDVHYVMGLSVDLGPVEPGRFVMVRVARGLDPLLRRPFGVYDVMGTRARRGRGGFSGSGIEIVYKVVGKGTTMLAGLEPGETVDVLGPLGNGFPPPPPGKRLIMVAGGIGVAPFKLLARRHPAAVLLFGARDRKEARLATDLGKAKVRVKVSTDDGSVGARGLVTALLDKELCRGNGGADAVVFACGPPGMLKAAYAAASAAGAACFVSLERAMACGMGACLGCAVLTRPCYGPGRTDEKAQTYGMVCSDGPVFDGSVIDWEMF